MGEEGKGLVFELLSPTWMGIPSPFIEQTTKQHDSDASSPHASVVAVADLENTSLPSLGIIGEKLE